MLLFTLIMNVIGIFLDMSKFYFMKLTADGMIKKDTHAQPPFTEMLCHLGTGIFFFSLPLARMLLARHPTPAYIMHVFTMVK